MPQFSSIRTPDAVRYRRRLGELFVTLDSYANAVVLVTFLLDIGIKLDEISLIRVMGDDSFIKLDYPFKKFDYNQLLDSLASKS